MGPAGASDLLLLLSPLPSLLLWLRQTRGQCLQLIVDGLLLPPQQQSDDYCRRKGAQYSDVDTYNDDHRTMLIFACKDKKKLLFLQ